MTETLEGIIERITFYNAENGYSVLRLKPRTSVRRNQANGGLVTVVGNLPELNNGEEVRFEGQWLTHPKHGMQFQALQAQRVLPSTAEGVERYLGSGLIKGVGPALAGRIVNHFGDASLAVIDNSPERLVEVKGISKAKALTIHNQWVQQRAIQDVMIFLQSHGISTGLAVKIFKAYGDQTAAIVARDPYQLARDIWGVGFKTADAIALRTGLKDDSPARQAAGLMHMLDTLTNDGHVYCPQSELLPRTAKLLGTPDTDLTLALAQLVDSRHVEREPFENGENAIYLTPFYHAEVGVARRLGQLVSTKKSRLSALREKPLPQLLAAAQRNVTLSETQIQALLQAIQHKVSVITGGPGTGKTTALQALIAVLVQHGYSVALASPTGRAARRLAESTGQPAQTLHRLLGYQPPNDFKHNAEQPLACDILVIDEASMLDLLLMNHVLKALPAESHLVLVGDVDQLPSVGAGDVLRNIIDSDKVAVTRLQQIYRQAEQSYIVENAHRVNAGQLPEFSQAAEDFFVFDIEGTEAVGDWVVDVVQNRIPRKFGVHPLRDIQVLVPMYRGEAGVHTLNERLQAALNPASPRSAERKINGTVFRVGDKVMQVRNNYEKDVFNGDVGLVTSLDGETQTLTVNFDGTAVRYDWVETDELTHAFAISVHKSQGSEYPVVVVPMVTQHYLMLQRNLLYTAITRAKQICVLVGNKKALGIAVSNQRVVQRYTLLTERLRDGGARSGHG